MNRLSAIAYLNGKFFPLEECRISVLDRGFLFGDGIYEVIPVYNRSVFESELHFERMRRGLERIGIAVPQTDAKWLDIFARLIRDSKCDNLAIYLQITRGVAPRSHYVVDHIQPTTFAMTMALSRTADDVLCQGTTAITAEDTRWHHCDIKTISLAANVLLRKKAVEANAYEVILFRDKVLTEGAAANVLIVFGTSVAEAQLATPPKDNWILPGITREVVKRLAVEHSIPFVERRISEEEIKAADEVWLTSSTKEILPVVSIDGRTIGGGKPGVVRAQFSRWLNALK